MRFVETPIFTAVIARVLGDDEYANLQHSLICRPDLGAVVPGSGGIRKVRWRSPGSGKRGGLRIIYFWQPEPEVFYMLFAYRKSDQSDLTPAQLRATNRLVEKEFS